MKIYLVGGAVRDKLLGLPVKERDWVVVGATVEDMLKLRYRQVGKEFPVFIHPKTGEEYALARMERKVQPGYRGFTFDTSPEVTLKEDLVRRDLTINAMAETSEGALVDPYHGQRDLQEKVLRHVSPAFSEDPVRILRIGRFLARYAHLGFTLAPETLALMKHMVESGEVDALVPERVWKELERALGEKTPEKFFEVLAACDALERLLGFINNPPHYFAPQGIGMKTLHAASTLTPSSLIRFAALLHAAHDAKNKIAQFANQYRIPNAYRDLAILVALHYEQALRERALSANDLMGLFHTLDAYRRTPRFDDFLMACKAIAASLNKPFDLAWMKACAEAAKSVNVQALIQEGYKNGALIKKLKEKRLDKISTFMNSG